MSTADGSTEPGVLSPAERYAASRARTARSQVGSGTRLAEFRSELGFELDDFQVAACQALEDGRGVLVAAPTGAGKTVVGEFAVHLALAQGGKAFYTTPIKALSNQKYADLVRRHGVENVGLLTGDTTINGEAPVVVMTTEVLRNMLYAGSRTLEGLAFVVMDEVHYLADRFRGPVWEEVIIHLADHVQLVSLSATVSNAEEFGDWLEMVRGDTAVVVSERRPVPLWQHVVVSAREPRGTPRLYDLYAGHVDPTDPGVNPPINPELHDVFRTSGRRADDDGRSGNGRRGSGQRGPGDRGYRGRGGYRPGVAGLAPQRRTPPRFAVVDALDADALLPAIYFIFSRAGCEGAVQQCLTAGLRLTSPQEEAEIRRLVEQRTATIPPEDLDVLGYWSWLQALARGIAAHHAGLLPVFKETVEDLFARGLVKVVFATETLALGINMPARSVVLEKLVKWDGTAHQPVTPGEYTQLTGRAGRRGIDVEGHAVVVDHTGLDPVALAGLASRRTYPLRSSFRPTYNMAVNLVSQVGHDRAREVLETSFAQFQADRGVVGLAKQAQAHAEALDGYAQAMACDRGDFAQYMAIRRQISDREKELSRAASGARRAEAVASFENLKRGDVVEVPSGRRRGFVLVLDPGHDDRSFDGPRPTVLTQEKQVKKLTLADAPGGVTVVTRVKIPKAFNPRRPDARRDLASTMRNALGAFRDDAGTRSHGAARPGRGPGRRSDAASDKELASLRSRLRAHPCHSCPDRDDHARWAERHDQLAGEHRRLVQRIEGRTGSVARIFDKTCTVLETLRYLDRSDDAGSDGRGELQVTADGAWLRRVYAENDLLLAECLRRGTWDGLDAPGLAAAVSTVVYSGRREDAAEPYVPGGPHGRLAQALDATVRVWSEVTDLEELHGLDATGPLDLGIVAPVHRWAGGKGLDAVLRGTDLAAGDFVRWCKQVVDVLDQLAQAAPTPALRATARKAQHAVLRGVVAYSSV
ncbi:DEAD/DEAH box helicase domain protein [Xylanimonas cellulosilytica DSM 15894]|uniref:DEAD/DEAH box helicase domain protein n=1 Tax=Xylanimonas cellulosilytica (strain DSM 15894 / JCM 12276 / CECT 5975 / KCTC 9989 / LMG 20990 / NBRC 107835 / XIL07) TaxID=446471 RepID=D1BSV5_XYLCX|nr:DEAD/DEAH box helicase [Xylanimonas cellulosilytica]ACZ30797.1 DEAD/DEAH box helicase domain protein [Xylanimonas cellulosilytica DSM 15894]